MKPEFSILIVGNFLNQTQGFFSVGAALARGLQASGMRVFTASSQRNRILRFLDMLRVIWLLARHYQLALVEVYSGLAFLWAEASCQLLRMLGKPFVLVLHGGNLPEFARRHPRRVKRLLGAAAAVTAPSPYLQTGLHAFRQDIRLIPNPLDLAAYPFHVREKPRPVLVWLRAFHRIYNPGLAVQVVSLLAPEYPDLRLIMVGPDKGDGSLPEVLNKAEELGVSSRIEITGGVPKPAVPAALNRGDIFINTTNIDNTPVSVLEAMACGLCVVSTDVGGIPYLLEDQFDGLLVPVNQPEAMAQALRRLLTEPGLAQRLSESGRRKAEQLDWGKILPLWFDLLVKVSNSRQGRL